MPHEVETMAYTNEAPWHGLGKSRPDGWRTVRSLLKDAGLDWTVEREEMYDMHGEPIPGFAALVRDRSILDVVGSRYYPTQNEEVFEFFKDFIERDKSATLETAGSLRNGQIVWCLARLNRSFKLAGNDEVKAYLLATASHVRGKSNVFKFVAERVVCRNTLSLALRETGTEHRANHRAQFSMERIEKAKDALGIARYQFGEFERNARKLKKIKMTIDESRELLRPIYAPESDPSEPDPRRLARIMHALEYAPGADAGTAWGTLNAATYWANHMAGRTADARLTNAWLGVAANEQEKVLEAVLALA